jgi:hypothetical protein
MTAKIANRSAHRSAVATVAKRAKAASAVADDGYLGDLIAWDFEGTGFSVPRADVQALFDACGFENCLPWVDETVAHALSRAPRTNVRKGRGIVVESLDRHKSDTGYAVAVYRKETVEGEVGDEFVAGARVRVDPSTGRAVALPLEGQTTADPRCMSVAQDIADKANEIAFNVVNDELSKALTTAGARAMWARFRRNAGGVYFMPAANAERFRNLLDGLEAMGGFYGTVQPIAVDGDGRSLRNASRAAVGSLEDDLTKLTAELKKAQDGTARESTMEKRIVELDALLARADLYGELLAEKADELKASAAAIKAGFERALSGEDEVFAVAATAAADKRFAKAINVVEEEVDEADVLFG